jgi:hypothetical protein
MKYRVHAKGRFDVFEPYLQEDGTYPVYSVEKMAQTGKPIHHAVNKVKGVTTIERAVKLVKKENCRWRLEGRKTGRKNVFAPDSIFVETMDQAPTLKPGNTQATMPRVNPNRQGWKQFLTARKSMLDAFDKAKQQDALHETHTYRGTVAESEFRAWLSNFLPKKFGISPGYVISQGTSDDTKALHFDVIIYDQLEAPVLWIETNPDQSSGGMSRAIPVEHVRAVIEVKSSLNPTSAREAATHLLDLRPLLLKTDPPGERYPKYLPANFVFTAVFFEFLEAYQYSLGMFTNLAPLMQYQQFFGPMILRSEGRKSNASGKGFLAVSDESQMPAKGQAKRSYFQGGIVHEIQLADNQFLVLFLEWAEVFFSQFAFDLIARLNGTFEVGRVSSFHAMGQSNLRYLGEGP